mmetsp:Transcript_47291/g.133380  ORF Transcript_47291/g.133380 Transcript_47291/m.133380 type:complete len:230 (+) Transcript_47291:239-928(+)
MLTMPTIRQHQRATNVTHSDTLIRCLWACRLKFAAASARVGRSRMVPPKAGADAADPGASATAESSRHGGCAKPTLLLSKSKTLTNSSRNTPPSTQRSSIGLLTSVPNSGTSCNRRLDSPGSPDALLRGDRIENGGVGAEMPLAVIRGSTPCDGIVVMLPRDAMGRPDGRLFVGEMLPATRPLRISIGSRDVMGFCCTSRRHSTSSPSRVDSTVLKSFSGGSTNCLPSK